MSKGFIAALTGIAITLLAWYGPWAWPSWPAFMAIDLLFGGHTAFADRPYADRAAIVVGLIVLNVTFWAVIVYAMVRGLSRLRGKGAQREAPGVHS